MPFYDYVTEFAGLPVVNFPEGYRDLNEFGDARREAQENGLPLPEAVRRHPARTTALADPSSVAWRLRDDGHDTHPRPPSTEGNTHDPRRSCLEHFVEKIDTERVTALIIGPMSDEPGVDVDECRDALLHYSDRLPNLRALFFAELTMMDSEISWIRQGDTAPLLAAFPHLTEFTVRGGNGLRIHVSEHTSLRSLTIQTGGMPGQAARDVTASGLPNLEHLELWLGSQSYGYDVGVGDLAPVLSGETFPRLRSLGLRNAEDTDTWVRALADAPVTRTLVTLDLSKGTLSDEGASVLLDSPVFRNLKRLDLHHHYLSKDTAERLRAEFTAAGIEIDVSHRREAELDEFYDPDDEDFDPSDYFYPAVAE
ncbi:STM4015 family protein [Nocardiopsis lucentensis]|uniref:STM4015 family protein n=1 Tax=Nocardiopsis lucentensis TaxID=53441 RepID=UPI00034D5E37|nr:STM4015 family protein [Nocardiopsis lucentensis]